MKFPLQHHLKIASLFIVIIVTYTYSDWNKSSEGMDWHDGDWDNMAYNFVEGDSGLYVATRGGIYLTKNEGVSWTVVIEGIPHIPEAWYITKIDSELYVGIYYQQKGQRITRLYKKTEDSKSWSVLSAMTFYSPPTGIIIQNDCFLVSTEKDGLLRSKNSTGFITSFDNPLNNYIQTCMIQKDSFSFVGTSGGLFSSTDGLSWQLLENELLNVQIISLAKTSNRLYAGTNAGVFESSNNGMNWTKVPGLSDKYINSVIIKNDSIYAATGNQVYFYSGNYGWSPIGDTLESSIAYIIIHNRYLFASTSSDGVWRIPLEEVVKISNFSRKVVQYTMNQPISAYRYHDCLGRTVHNRYSLRLLFSSRKNIYLK